MSEKFAGDYGAAATPIYPEVQLQAGVQPSNPPVNTNYNANTDFNTNANLQVGVQPSNPPVNANYNANADFNPNYNANVNNALNYGGYQQPQQPQQIPPGALSQPGQNQYITNMNNPQVQPNVQPQAPGGYYPQGMYPQTNAPNVVVVNPGYSRYGYGGAYGGYGGAYGSGVYGRPNSCGFPIPKISTGLATMCLILNCFFPGLGTMIAGCIKPENKIDYTTNCCCYFWLGFCHVTTAIFCVGWILAIVFGVQLMSVANLPLPEDDGVIAGGAVIGGGGAVVVASTY